MSNIIEELDNILYAARRNSENNPRISTLENLRKYYDKDLYVTFKSLEKVGVNPRAKWGHMSPVAVFAYPLDFVYNQFKLEEDHPYWAEHNFAFDKKYIYVLKRIDVPGLYFIDDASTYSSEDLESDILKLTPENIESKLQLKMYTNTYSFNDAIDLILEKNEYIPIKNLFRITQEISKFLSKNSEKMSGDDESTSHAATIWNSLFRIVLNYSGIADPCNIHPSHEDINYETMFFTNKAYKVIDSFDNDYYQSKVSEKNIKYSAEKIVASLAKKLIGEKQNRVKIPIDDNIFTVDLDEDHFTSFTTNGSKIYRLSVLSPGSLRTGGRFNEFINGLINSEFNNYPTTAKINIFINKLNGIIKNNKFGNTSFENLYTIFLTARDDLFMLYCNVYKLI